MTNLQYLRGAELGKLADILSHLDSCPNNRILGEDCAGYDSCRECWENWLEEERKDNVQEK